MRRYSLLAVALTFAVSLVVATSGAQAVVVDMSAIGQPTTTYNQYDLGSYVGVALVPTTADTLLAARIPTVTEPQGTPCLDPALSPDLGGPFLPIDKSTTPWQSPLCWHGSSSVPVGVVMHSNETFALTWDPLRRYFASTKNYVLQFLRDVADGSGTFTSPYAVTSQYTDATGRAANSSLYGGACTDYGSVGQATCDFSAATTGHDYPASGCPVTGTNFRFGTTLSPAPNDVCLTDAQLQVEIAAMIQQTGVVGHTKPGDTPLLVLLLPPGVETCIDRAGTLCSANGAPPSQARFCSYHSQVQIPNGPLVQYVVQPWTAETGSWIPPKSPPPPGWTPGCDEPDATPIPDPVDVQVLATDIGQRLVSPLSQAQIAAIVNPGLNGWFALDGSEINDNDIFNNGCVPEPKQLDAVTVGSNSYLLQREFNTAGMLETDPNALACTPVVNLTPRFVVPSSVNLGDIVEFDGSTTISSLIVPKAGYAWKFGDGTTAVGPSVEHSYAHGGTYAVTLTVTDRGGNVESLSQTVTVLGPPGPLPPPPPPPPPPSLHVQMQLMPQSLQLMLRAGVSIRVTSNEPADGIVSVSIPRSAAKRAHIRSGRASSVVIGRGTVAGIKDGTVSLHLKLSKATAAKLKHLGHVAVTVRVALVGAGRVQVAVVAAARY